MSDENCYKLTRKMVQFVLIAGEAITDGVTTAEQLENVLEKLFAA